ncbi:MAG: hypothetical protein Q9208_006153 [Pyrenodesmia sp. 3 TL-2023]
MSSMQPEATGSTGPGAWVEEHEDSAFTLLPAELEVMILRFVGPYHRDWKSARLVSTSWSAIVRPFLFEELWFTLSTMRRLADQETRSAISPYVKHLVLYPDVLPKVEYQVWEARSQSVSSSLSLSRRELQARFTRYLNARDNQSKFLGTQGNLLVHCALAEAIPSFLGLTKVTIGDCRLDKTGLIDGPHRLIERCPVWQDLGQLGLHDRYDLEQLGFRDRTLGTIMALEILDTVLAALSGSTVGISCLNVSHKDMLYSDDLEGNELFRFRSQTKASLKNLKTINVDLNFDYRSDDGWECETSPKLLNELLSAAEGLQELGLGVRRAGTPPFSGLRSFVDILGHMSLATSSLRKLHLSHVDPSGKSLRAFLFNHRETLRSLILDQVALTDDSRSSWRRGWPGTLHMIATSLRLQDISLRKLLDADGFGFMCFFQPVTPGDAAVSRLGSPNRSEAETYDLSHLQDIPPFPLLEFSGMPPPDIPPYHHGAPYNEFDERDGSSRLREEKIVNGILEGGEIETLCKEMWDSWMKDITNLENGSMQKVV